MSAETTGRLGRTRPASRRRGERRSDREAACGLVDAQACAPMLRHDAAHDRHASAHAFICASLPNSSHASSHALQMSAQSAQWRAWNADSRDIMDALIRQLSAQSISSRT